MAATVYPRILTEFDVDSTAYRLSLSISGSTYNVNLTQDTYDARTFLSHVTSRMTSASGRTFSGSIDPSTGRISILGGATNWTILGASGLYATETQTLFRRLGFEATSDLSSNASFIVTGSSQHQFGWYATYSTGSRSYYLPPADDTGARWESPHTTRTTTMNGQSLTRHFGANKTREVAFDFVPESKVHMSSSGWGANESLEELWLQASKGYRVLYFDDATLPGSYTTWVLHEDSLSAFAPELTVIAPPIYRYGIKLQQYVSG